MNTTENDDMDISSLTKKQATDAIAKVRKELGEYDDIDRTKTEKAKLKVIDAEIRDKLILESDLELHVQSLDEAEERKKALKAEQEAIASMEQAPVEEDLNEVLEVDSEEGSS